MSFFSNIIDALRRVGGATQKSALRRQDAQLEGMHVLDRRQINIRDGHDRINAFVATVAPAAETVNIMKLDDLIACIEELRSEGAIVLIKWDGQRTENVHTVVVTRDNTGFAWRKDCKHIQDALVEAIGAYEAHHAR